MSTKQNTLSMDELEYLAMKLIRSKGYALRHVSRSSMADNIDGRLFLLDKPLELSKAELDTLFSATGNYPMTYVPGTELSLHFVVRFMFWGEDDFNNQHSAIIK